MFIMEVMADTLVNGCEKPCWVWNWDIGLLTTFFMMSRNPFKMLWLISCIAFTTLRESSLLAQAVVELFVKLALSFSVVYNLVDKLSMLYFCCGHQISWHFARVDLELTEQVPLSLIDDFAELVDLFGWPVVEGSHSGCVGHLTLPLQHLLVLNSVLITITVIEKS